jgi:hypothetical protein
VIRSGGAVGAVHAWVAKQQTGQTGSSPEPTVQICTPFPSQIARAMPEYRAYVVGDDNHFVGFEPMICRDDAEAIIKARLLVDGHDIELWSGDRLVTRLSRDKET